MNEDDVNWQQIWNKAGFDILDIVADLGEGRDTWHTSAEKISKLCMLSFTQGYEIGRNYGIK